MSLSGDSWLDRAYCRAYGISVHTFYAEPKRGQTYEKARDVCSRCSVQTECLAAAMREEAPLAEAARLLAGMRGGMTARERWKGKNSARLVRELGLTPT